MDTPVPIPNTEVKPICADGTWGATPWESRTLPTFNEEPLGNEGFFVYDESKICNSIKKL